MPATREEMLENWMGLLPHDREITAAKAVDYFLGRYPRQHLTAIGAAKKLKASGQWVCREEKHTKYWTHKDALKGESA